MANRFQLHGIMLSGPCYKVALMLALSGEPFDYHHVALRAGAHKTPEYTAINRFAVVPTLTDTLYSRHLTQSAAVLEYLADTLGRFGGSTLDERLRAREWMYWDFDRLAVPVYRMRAIRRGARSFPQPTAEMWNADAETALDVLEAQLARTPWLAGENATIADIDVYGVVHYAPAGGFDLARRPHVQAWMTRFEALPGFARPEVLMPMPAA
jgi:glutathione S-transferase